ncbi:MAG: transporter substrate-binding domain-containing protein [Christensenellales bacterium]|nr:MAG: hypothetical protein DBX45_07425 [Oscillospiraceae bacterium]
MKATKILTAALAAAMLCASLSACGKTNDATETTAASGSDNKTTEKYTVLSEDFGAENYAIGFRRGDDALAKKVSDILAEMTADGKAGEIAKKWFGSDVMLRDPEYPRELNEEKGDASLQYILDKGELILGLDETFPPMGYRDANGDIIGFDIDLATEVCSRLGVKLKLQPINWDSKEMELNGKTIDCIWNGMSITDERINGMDLSTPYIANKQIIIVKSDSGISTKADLAGKTVGAQQGSSAVDAISAEPDVKASFGSLNEYASNDEAFLDLKAGRIDVLVVDEVYGRYMISQDK